MRQIIETERLILRQLDESDASDVFEWVGDPIVNKYMPYSLYHDIEQVKEWIRQISDENYELGFILKDTGKVIGSGSISFDSDRDAYALGYNMNKSFWNMGYATEAAKAMIQWAYDNLGARVFVSNHATENIASGNVIRKCGFQFERYGQYSRFDGSETFDAKFYRMHLD